MQSMYNEIAEAHNSCRPFSELRWYAKNGQRKYQMVSHYWTYSVF